MAYFQKILETKLVKRKHSQRGQISMMIGMMMSTFLLLLAFVINTGMLVNAKINLQNAADLAAYAGAAVQARQLTQISYLNYEMRRQYKKFLFRIYVIGNMSQDGFPKTGGDPSAMSYQAGSVDYGVPVTCVIFDSKDNYCHIDKLPKIEVPSKNFIDAINDTLADQLSKIEQLRQKNCESIGLTNLLLNIYWLYNADPSLNRSTTGGSLGGDQANTLQVIRGQTTGLGLIPREIILKFRIDTLASYVNAPPLQSITLDKANELKQAGDPFKNERSIQAFFSAYFTLGNHTFSGSEVYLDELIPPNLLGLKTIGQKFDTYAIDLAVGGSVSGSASSTAGDCIPMVNPVTVQHPVTLGVYKDPSILTYYAIRLRAKARVLFSPFGDLELKAYSAAQPFGSRIGPVPDDVASFFGTPPGSAPRNFVQQQNIGGTPPALQSPNLPVKASDSTAKGKGWDNKDVLGAIYSQMTTGAAGRTGAGTLGPDAILRAMHAAMAPNPWEATKYNIINDQGADQFVRNFGSDLKTAFWAPIFPPGTSTATIAESIRNEIEAAFSSDVTGHLGASGGGGSPMASIKSSVLGALQSYVQEDLQTGQGELGEGINIVKLSNPFKYMPSSGVPTEVHGDPNIFMVDPTQFKTSWNSGRTWARLESDGRVGYSVKFVSFNSLTQNKSTTDGSNSWTNGLQADEDAGTNDIPFLKH